MTDDEMKEQLQAAQDMIETLAQQRDGANNAIVQLNARVKQLERKLAAIEDAAEKGLSKIADANAAARDALNGHDAEAAALN